MLPLLSILMAAAISSCDKSDRGLLDTVPDSAQMVTTVDFESLMKNAGCQVKNGKYELTPELTTLLGDSDASSFTEWLSRFAKIIDMKHVVIYMMNQNTAVATVSITDTDALEVALSDYNLRKADTRDGFNIYEGKNKMIIMVKDSQAWLARKADDVINSVKKAGKKPVTELAGVSDFLSTDHPVNFAYRYNGMMFNWMCGSVTLNDNILGMTIKAIDDKGKTMEFGPLLNPVSTDFLRYTPANTQLAAAFSIKADIPWDQCLTILKAHPSLSMSQKGAIEMIITQLKKIDGTVALSASPAAGAPALSQFSLSAWDIMLMAHMSPENVNSNVEQLVAMGKQFGIKVENDGGVYHANLSRLDPSLGDLYIGNIDGYFAVSTRPFDTTSDSSLKQVFEGRCGAIALDIPYGSETMKAFGLPYGFSLTIQLESKSIELRARFNGTSGSFISSLVNMIQGLN